MKPFPTGTEPFVGDRMHKVFCPLSLLLLSASQIPNLYSSEGPNLLNNQVRIQPQAASSGASLRVDVNMTLVPVSVTDPLGRNVTGLTKENFLLFDGDKAQPIVSFNREDAPISIGFVLDSSRSMTDKFPMAREAATRLFAQCNPEDEAFLITVATRAEVRQPFTSNFGDIGNALTFVRPEGTTSLLDGVLLGLSTLKKAHNPRRALIIVSDGGDNNSRYTLREVAARAVEANAMIYTIGIFRDPQSVEEAEGPNLLANLASQSGGMSRFVQEPHELGEALAGFGVALHNQYVLGYYAPQNSQSGKYRKLKVRLVLPSGVPKLAIYTRAGYYVPEH
jgi:Ca-activated chloride channel family protein